MINTKAVRSGSILAAIGLTSLAVNPASAQSMSDVMKQMQMMQKRIDQLETELKQTQKAQTTRMAQPQATRKAAPVAAAPPAPMTPPPATIAAAPPPEGAIEYVKKGALPGSFLVPGTNTSVRVGGYVKADGIYDTGVQQGDTIDPGATALKGKGVPTSGNFRFTARESRIYVKTFTPTDYGDLKTNIEGDFYGGGGGNSLSTNSYNFRLRQAYGELGPFLAGQSWTTFMDVDALPETLDFNGPTGQVLVRQPQFRYTYDAKTAGVFAIALESPQGDFLDADSNVPSSNAVNVTPDFVGKWVYSGRYGHISFSGVGRDIKIDNGIAGSSKPSYFGYGLEFASVITNFYGRDNILVEIAGGDGIGRYFFDNGGGSNLSGGGYSAATSGLGGLNPTEQTQSSYGGYIGYQHWWTDYVRSTAVYGRQQNEISDSVAHLAGVDLNKLLQTVHANLIWSPFTGVDVGAEYIYTKRNNTMGQAGEANRIQVSVKYAF